MDFIFNTNLIREAPKWDDKKFRSKNKFFRLFGRPEKKDQSWNGHLRFNPRNDILRIH